jgi:hypothetical protein
MTTKICGGGAVAGASRHRSTGADAGDRAEASGDDVRGFFLPAAAASSETPGSGAAAVVGGGGGGGGGARQRAFGSTGEGKTGAT